MIKIMSEQEFKDKVIPNELDSNTFYISVLDPIYKSNPLLLDSFNYKTWYFYDLLYDIDTYKSFTFEQAQEINDFIALHFGKKLVVHCGAGVSRSAAIAEHYHELLGGSYSSLLEANPHIIPNGRVLQYLRSAAKEKIQTKYI